MKKKAKKSGLRKASVVIIGVILIVAAIYYFYSTEQAQIRGFNFGNELQSIQEELKHEQTDFFSKISMWEEGNISKTQFLEFADIHIMKMDSIITKITKRTELFGLCGSDFIIDENQSIFVIDINPRPPATFELHESQESLFAAHIKSFNGGPINYISYNHNFSKGYVIYYAKENLLIPENLKWPSWVKDRPYDKQMILIKNPVCTIHAEGGSEQEVENKLINRLKEIELFIKSI